MVRAGFHKLAERELNEAAQYYELETPGLGVAFLNEVEECQRSIEQHPEAGTVVQGRVRRPFFIASRTLFSTPSLLAEFESWQS
jgi:hypothetical protein